MQYYMPVQVYEETDAVLHHPEVFIRAGKKALIVTGRHSAKANGSYADVQEVLSQGGISSVLFDRVEENPSIATVMDARDFGLKEGVDFVIGIGGGSPMDAAKAIALMLRHRDEDASYLYSSSDTDRLPLILIPTTCGTGSEVTGVSVLTIPEKRTKGSISHKIFADTALIDGKYLAFASARVIRNTAIDALGHLIESRINADATDYSRMCVDAGLKCWAKSRALLLQDPSTYTPEDRMRLMRASAFAGMAIAQTGTSLPHGLSYPVTYELHMPHGQAIGYFEAGYLAAASREDRDYILEAAGFASLQDFEDYYERVCGSEKIPGDMLRHAVDVLCANSAKLKKAPFACTRSTVEKIAFYREG